jgi:hypothetical protein
MTECPNCEKDYHGRACPDCGFTLKTLEKSSTVPHCPIDGQPLHTEPPTKGFCERGGGYPVTMSCPFACPICRHDLDWSGGCSGCHGTQSMSGKDWTFPGDGYYTHDVQGRPIGDGQHYVKEQGSRPAASPRDVRDFVAKLAGKM